MPKLKPSVTATDHVLPFEKLSDEDFERLCLALVSEEGYEHAAHLGMAGSDAGRDIVAYRGERRFIFQCKRYKTFGPADAEAAVVKAFALPYRLLPEVFVLMVTCKVTPRTRERAEATGGSMPVEIWAITELDQKVGKHQDLVKRFFRQDFAPRVAPHSLLPPKLPPHYLERTQSMEELSKVLLSPTRGKVGITGEGILGLQGMGGIGKTVLAAAIARDPTIQAAFPDGVLWLAVGQQPNLLGLLTDLAAALGETGAFTSPSHARGVISKLMADRAVLLVMDDVWTLEQAQELDVIGPAGRLLFTTRNAEVLVGLGAAEHQVALLSPDHAVALLASWVGTPVFELPPVAWEVARECGYLPLALAMIGALIRIRQQPLAWSDALQRLQRADLEQLQTRFPGYPYPNLLRALDVSVEALEPQERQRYLELAVFPEDIAIPEAVLEVLWSPAGLRAEDVRELSASFVARSLAMRAEEGRIRLHDLLRQYLKQKDHEPSESHRRFVAAYSRVCPEGFASGPDDGYFFEWLPYHLHRAGSRDTLRALLFDFHWMAAKLRTMDVSYLLADYGLSDGDPEADAIYKALAQAALIVSQDPAQLADQLLARLQGKKGAEVARLLEFVVQNSARSRLRFLFPTLNQQFLLRVLEGHSRAVTSLAPLDERRIASASLDGTLRVWDAFSGKELLTLKDPVGPILALASISAELVVTISMNKKGASIYTWNLSAREIIQRVEGVQSYPFNLARLKGSDILYCDFHGLHFWNAISGRDLRLIRTDPTHLAILAISDDGNILHAGSTIQVRDAKSGQVIKALYGRGQPAGNSRITALAMAGPNLIAAGMSDGSIKTWDIVREKPVAVLNGHEAEVTALARIGSHRLASGSRDGTVRIWHPASGIATSILKGHTAPVTALARVGEKHLVSASEDGALFVWQTESNLHGPQRHVRAVTSLANLDSHRIASSSQDGSIRVWSLTNGRTLFTLRETSSSAHLDPIEAVARLDGHRIVSSSSSGELRIWNTKSGQPYLSRKTNEHVTAIERIDERRIAFSWSTNVAAWDIKTNSAKTLHSFHTGQLTAIVRLAARLFASASQDRSIRIWSVDPCALALTLRGHRGVVNAIARVDEECIVSASSDKTLRLWSMRSGRTLAILRGHTDSVNSVAVLNGKLISAASDRTVRVWDLKSRREIAVLTLDAPATAVTVALDGSTAIVGDTQGCVHFLCFED